MTTGEIFSRLTCVEQSTNGSLLSVFSSAESNSKVNILRRLKSSTTYLQRWFRLRHFSPPGRPPSGVCRRRWLRCSLELCSSSSSCYLWIVSTSAAEPVAFRHIPTIPTSCCVAICSSYRSSAIDCYCKSCCRPSPRLSCYVMTLCLPFCSCKGWGKFFVIFREATGSGDDMLSR